MGDFRKGFGVLDFEAGEGTRMEMRRLRRKWEMGVLVMVRKRW